MGILNFWKKKKDENWFPKDLDKKMQEMFIECEKEVEKHGRTKDGHTILWEVINKRRGNQNFAPREPGTKIHPDVDKRTAIQSDATSSSQSTQSISSRDSEGTGSNSRTNEERSQQSRTSSERYSKSPGRYTEI